MASSAHHIAWFNQIDKHDVPLVGGKGANLGEITNAGFNVPNGFVVTSHAYYDFIRENNLAVKIKHLLSTANFNNSKSLDQISKHIRDTIRKGKLSEELAKEIIASYKKLGGALSDPLVAVRSSATAEDLANASFAGQQESYLNVQGDAVLIEKIKEGWSSLFGARAIFYRHEQKFDHLKIGIALVVQKMVESEKSGIMFTIDPMTNDKSKIVIESIFGLGELIVGGRENPDHYEVSKKDFSLLSKKISLQNLMLKKVGSNDKEIKLSKKNGSKQKLTDKEIIGLAKIGAELEKHYYFPQDIEWAIEKGIIYIVQTRAVTTTHTATKPTENTDLSHAVILLKGDPASPGIASGPAKVIKSAKEIDKVLVGDILVAPQTNPDFVPAMKKAAAIVTDYGGRTSHAAIVSRELGIPAIVGTKNATKILKTGTVISVNGSKGEVYKGGFSEKHTEHSSTEDTLKTATKVYVNLAEPELADRHAARNVDGIGLLRAEFMMAGIGVHPKKMIRDGKGHIYTEKLTEDLVKFCSAFNPRPVVYRASDFKTNEYRNLTGGKDFEPIESNPMLGFRGAFRYIHDPEVFKLELQAIKNVREKHGFKNLWLMIPFVRNVEELVKVKKIVNDFGLTRSSSFKLWMMVEIPSNVIMLEKFLEVGIDGVSIGSNDLTMLILGTDRDNFEVANEFNEMNPSVMWAFEHVVKTAHKFGVTSSMCGQAVSTYPDLVKRLVELGITSVSVSPDTIENTRKLIAHFEKTNFIKIMAKIKQIFARQILNAKGEPTIETTVILTDGAVGIASVPTGTSIGKYEAVDLRDNDPKRFQGKSVENAIENIQKLISPILLGSDATNQQQIDKKMISLDGTTNKSKLGANAILAVSIACAKAAARSAVLPLFLYLREYVKKNDSQLKIPTPCFNILNGGLHGGGNIDFQEFLVIPATSRSFSDSLEQGVGVYFSLKKVLEDNNLSSLIGFEGGFSPKFSTNMDALATIKKAIESANLRIGFDMFIGIDAASNNFFDEGEYKIKDKSQALSAKELIAFYNLINQEYHLLYLEDGLSEDDWAGWQELYSLMSQQTIISGDDLTATNPIRLSEAIQKRAINSIIIKPNQIGTVIEALAVTEMAKQAGLKIIVSHRSGETNDDFIADFSVAVSADYVKFGAPVRGERVAKYNRLLSIEKQIKSL